ncbi:hypothetical protein HDU97_007314 [Phlyctochytrium planicorne]|nr:hypothetical protein HDU97_007314 [Phlyctochytrium planicorne]
MVSIALMVLSSVLLALAPVTFSSPVSVHRRSSNYYANSFTSLPAEIADAGFVKYSNIVTGTLNAVGNESYGYVKLSLPKGGGAATAVSTRAFNAGEAACSRLYFPSKDYGGVAMTFYTIASNSVSSNDGTKDEIDFEFLGNSTAFQINYFKKGSGGHEARFTVNTTTTDLCIVNSGSMIKWYVNGAKIAEKTDVLGSMYVWWTMWETTGHWDCCGVETASSFEMQIKQFSIYTLGTFPSTNSCTASTTCSPSFSKIGITNNAAYNATVTFQRAFQFFNVCSSLPKGYSEMCIPGLISGDNLTATANAVVATLDWTKVKAQGNFYGFNVTDATFASTLPASNNCATSVTCMSPYAKVGITSTSSANVSVTFTTGSTVFKACSAVSKGYTEMCLPAFSYGDSLVATTSGATYTLDWTKVTPQGNFYGFNISDASFMAGYPSTNNCAASVACNGELYSKIGLVKTGTAGASVAFVRGSTVFNACSLTSAGYTEMCVPAFKSGDTLKATVGGVDTVLDWTKVTAQGYYFQLTLNA